MSESEQQTLRGAVIGAGYFSQFHFDAWNRIEGVRIESVCDVDREKAETFAAQFEIPHVFSDHRTMLDHFGEGDQRLDFVDVVTRPDTHRPIVQDVADRGIAVICQKPLAPTAEEAEQIVAIAKEANVPFMVHENFRFQPWYREVKTLLDDQRIGDQLHTISFRNRAGDGHGDDAYLARQPYFQTMEKFLIFEAGIHTIDTFRFLAGEVEKVWCSTRKLNPVIAGEDSALAIFQFVDGGQGLYDANRFNESTAANPRYTFGELLVEGNGGTIRLHDDGRLTVQELGKRETSHDYSPSTHGFAGDCVFATQQHFADGLRLNLNKFETDGPSYLKSIAVQEAMYRSAESGCWEACPR
jgi:predicted dehydrogenase